VNNVQYHVSRPSRCRRRLRRNFAEYRVTAYNRRGWRAERDSNSSYIERCYAASFGMALSTNRKNRVLRVPQPNILLSQQSPIMRLLRFWVPDGPDLSIRSSRMPLSLSICQGLSSSCQRTEGWERRLPASSASRYWQPPAPKTCLCDCSPYCRGKSKPTVQRR
jgi:hypothetical protein